MTTIVTIALVVLILVLLGALLHLQAKNIAQKARLQALEERLQQADFLIGQIQMLIQVTREAVHRAS